ncbi:hypothetical protein L1987_55777 [Smallanthus sonchifolius]|uniref:Uncharacterized protein n=1 Tax=Smallanthus sonchifolius TaxID=185202 RepID=A0ACB9EBY8_9ASTR|nr:hypothetical protein L1987_55777 [Smallanthus sonchifolius]
MASACLNSIGLSPENILECSPKYSSYGWFRSRLSISSEMSEEDASKIKNKRISPAKILSDLPDVSDPAKELTDLPSESDANEFDGFEFSLVDPVMMLPADELFSDGKLVPLHFSIRQEVATSTTNIMPGVRPPDTPYSRQRIADVFAADPRNEKLVTTMADQIEAND